MIRLFTGIALPPHLCQQLSRLQGGVHGALWTKTENYHITLSFIGNVDEATAEDVDEALSKVRAPEFNLALKGTGTFARGDVPGHLWIGVTHNEALYSLKEKIDRALEMRKLPYKKQKYTPHVTMAALQEGNALHITEFMQMHNLFSSEEFEVKDFILYKSHQTSEGPMYEALKSYPLSFVPLAHGEN